MKWWQKLLFKKAKKMVHTEEPQLEKYVDEYGNMPLALQKLTDRDYLHNASSPEAARHGSPAAPNARSFFEGPAVVEPERQLFLR